MLRIQWETGKTYTQENVTETTFRKSGEASTPQVMTVTQTTTMAAKKDPAAGSNLHLVEVRFASVKGELKAGAQVTHYDSDHPEDSNRTLGEAIGRAVSKTFVLVYDEHDRFRETRELGSLAASKGSIASLSSLADSRDVANLFRKSMEMGLPPLPVSVGDTWTADETITFPKAGDTHVEINGKFEALEQRDGRKHAKITFEGHLAAAAKKDKPIENVGIGEGSTISGVIYYDLERHTPSYSTYTNPLKLIIDAREFPFEQKVTSRLISVTDSH